MLGRAVAAALLLCGAGCATAAKPVVVPTSSTPVATLVNGICWVRPTPDTGKASRVVTVDPHPLDATAAWIPAGDQRPCRVVTTPVARAQAERLAADIRSARTLPTSGTFNCPNANSSGVDLFFHYAGRTEVATVGLSGCAGVSAPARLGRYVTDALRRDLAEIAPSPWKGQLSAR